MGDTRKTVAMNIRKLCAVKGIRQVDISRRLGVSQGTVANWLKGTNGIDIDHLAELCAFLGVSLDQIFGIDHVEDVVLTQGEKELLDLYRLMSPDTQAALLVTARAIAGANIEKEDTVSGMV